MICLLKWATFPNQELHAITNNVLKNWQVRQSTDVAEETTEDDCLIKLKERSKLDTISQVQDVDVAVQKDPHWAWEIPFALSAFLSD